MKLTTLVKRVYYTFDVFFWCLALLAYIVIMIGLCFLLGSILPLVGGLIIFLGTVTLACFWTEITCRWKKSKEKYGD